MNHDEPKPRRHRAPFDVLLFAFFASMVFIVLWGNLVGLDAWFIVGLISAAAFGVGEFVEDTIVFRRWHNGLPATQPTQPTQTSSTR